MKNKEFVTAIIFVFADLFIYTLFPVENVFQQIMTLLIFFVVMPMIFNKFILKRDLSFLKLNIGDYKAGLFFSFVSLLILGVIFLMISNYTEFLWNYTIPSAIVENFSKFISYMFLVAAPVVFVYEFFFRGFLMSTIENKTGKWAILIQAVILFSLVMVSGEENSIQFFPYLIFAPFGGYIAQKSRSIIYSGATQFVLLLALNLIIIEKIA